MSPTHEEGSGGSLRVETSQAQAFGLLSFTESEPDNSTLKAIHLLSTSGILFSSSRALVPCNEDVGFGAWSFLETSSGFSSTSTSTIVLVKLLVLELVLEPAPKVVAGAVAAQDS